MLHSLGPKRTLSWVFCLAMTCFAGLTLAVVSHVARDELEAAARARLTASARAAAAQLAGAMATGKDDLVARELEELPRSADDGFVAVLRPDGAVAARWARAGESERLASALARVASSPWSSGVLDGVALEPVHGAGAPDPRRAEAQPGRRVVGRVLVGGSRDVVEGPLARVRTATFAVLLATGAGLAALLWWLAGGLLFRPLAEMRQVAGRLCEYDLAARATKRGDDELGRLADALNRIGENLAGTLARMSDVSHGVAGVVERIGHAGSKLARGTSTVSAQVEETGSSMGAMIASLHGIADNVEVLAQSAEESSSSILQMATTNSEVAENVQGLAASVSETTAAIEQMTVSIKEAATSIEDLAATAEQTSSSMNEMDVSIHQVETNANETAKLSEQALKDAELSTEALSRTLVGIERIKDSSKEAASVIDSLGRKIGTIGNILNVIDEVAEQTNLLALNAAILAAQSGEHGKGFAVVADEIKDLAERTGASTKEIAELIRSVQDESANAVAAMDRGVKNVEEGVRLGQEAEAALKQIQASSVKSTQMVKAIARATIEQARGSKQVTTAINRIAETVQQIAGSIGEQARGSEQIMKSSDKMKVITAHVERSTQEQAQGSKQVSRATESISEMVKHLNRAQKDQTQGSERVLGAVQQIRSVEREQADSVRDLEASIAELTAQAQVLRREVERFSV